MSLDGVCSRSGNNRDVPEQYTMLCCTYVLQGRAMGTGQWLKRTFNHVPPASMPSLLFRLSATRPFRLRYHRLIDYLRVVVDGSNRERVRRCVDLDKVVRFDGNRGGF